MLPTEKMVLSRNIYLSMAGNKTPTYINAKEATGYRSGLFPLTVIVAITTGIGDQVFASKRALLPPTLLLIISRKALSHDRSMRMKWKNRRRGSMDCFTIDPTEINASAAELSSTAYTT
jgi:hypothetical protein